MTAAEKDEFSNEKGMAQLYDDHSLFDGCQSRAVWRSDESQAQLPQIALPLQIIIQELIIIISAQLLAILLQAYRKESILMILYFIVSIFLKWLIIGWQEIPLQVRK